MVRVNRPHPHTNPRAGAAFERIFCPVGAKTQANRRPCLTLSRRILLAARSKE